MAGIQKRDVGWSLRPADSDRQVGRLLMDWAKAIGLGLVRMLDACLLAVAYVTIATVKYVASLVFLILLAVFKMVFWFSVGFLVALLLSPFHTPKARANSD